MNIADNDRIVPKMDVLKMTGLTSTTLAREIKAERFPPPVPISPHRVGWLESTVRQWMQERVRQAYRREPKAA